MIIRYDTVSSLIKSGLFNKSVSWLCVGIKLSPNVWVKGGIFSEGIDRDLEAKFQGDITHWYIAKYVFVLFFKIFNFQSNGIIGILKTKIYPAAIYDVSVLTHLL